MWICAVRSVYGPSWLLYLRRESLTFLTYQSSEQYLNLVSQSMLKIQLKIKSQLSGELFKPWLNCEPYIKACKSRQVVATSTANFQVTPAGSNSSLAEPATCDSRTKSITLKSKTLSLLLQTCYYLKLERVEYDLLQ